MQLVIYAKVVFQLKKLTEEVYFLTLLFKIVNGELLIIKLKSPCTVNQNAHSKNTRHVSTLQSCVFKFCLIEVPLK